MMTCKNDLLKGGASSIFKTWKKRLHHVSFLTIRGEALAKKGCSFLMWSNFVISLKSFICTWTYTRTQRVVHFSYIMQCISPSMWISSWYKMLHPSTCYDRLLSDTSHDTRYYGPSEILLYLFHYSYLLSFSFISTSFSAFPTHFFPLTRQLNSYKGNSTNFFAISSPIPRQFPPQSLAISCAYQPHYLFHST